MRPSNTSGTKAGRKTLKSTASVLGLTAGAIGWSGLANASSDKSGPQTLLLPDHYRLINDGFVVFQLEGGQELTLNPDQYAILQDGLLLTTDGLAQASMQSLPVMGSIRAQLTSDLQPVRSPDGSVVLAADHSPLWSGDGPALRLFEEVDIQRYELAQNSAETQTQSEGNLGQAAGAAAGGLSLAGLSLLTSIPGTRSEQATEETTAAASTPASAPAPAEFLSDAMFQALTPANARVFTGSSGDSFIGYTAADSSAENPLIDAGKGLGNSATFDMTAGGDNLLLAAGSAGAYTDGSFNYTGGSGKDDLDFGPALGAYGGNVTLNAGNGDNTMTAGNSAAATVGSLVYTGGTGLDVLTFGDQFAASGTAVLDLGSDTAADKVTFQGSIGKSGGSVTIKNFNYNDDQIDITDTGQSATAGEIQPTNGNKDLTWTDGNGFHTIVFAEIGPNGTGVVATTAQLLADII